MPKKDIELEHKIQYVSILDQDGKLDSVLTVSPLDDKKFTESARKTGRVVIVHEAHRSFEPGAEMVARLMEKSFLHLEAPVPRIAGYDVVIPLYQRERNFVPDVKRILQGARETLEF